MWVPNLQDIGLVVGVAASVVAAVPVQAEENYVLGICQVSRSDSGAEIRPTYDGDSYLGSYHDGDSRYRGFGFDSAGTNVTLVKAPKHGEVYLVDTQLGKAHSWYHYMPTEGYVGEDRFVMQVERNGIKIRIQYLIQGLDKSESSVGTCEPDMWKISSLSDYSNLIAGQWTDFSSRRNRGQTTISH